MASANLGGVAVVILGISVRPLPRCRVWQTRFLRAFDDGLSVVTHQWRVGGRVTI
jgi:hypothetical protein